VKAFSKDCMARGGVLGGLDRTNEWLQTVEDGFYCHFHQDGEKCWRFLSYSGSVGAGGEPECEQDNVLPTPTGPNEALAITRLVQQKSEETPAAKAELSSQAQTTTPKPSTSKPSTSQPTTPTPTTPKPTTPAPTAPAPTVPTLHDLGAPTGTAAPKIEFSPSQTYFNAQVGESFSYSFCRPALTRASDICTSSATNPKYGLPPYSFYVESGSFLPFGLTLNLNGLITGTPTAAGSRTANICAKDTGGFYACRSITIEVAPKAAPEPTGTVSISSGSCTFLSQHQGYNIYETVFSYDVRVSGTVSGSEGARFDPGVNPGWNAQINCGSWSTSVDYYDTICVRQAGQPESTSWSVQYQYDWFDRPANTQSFVVQVQSPEGAQIQVARGNYPCE